MQEGVEEYNLKMSSVCVNCRKTYGYHYSSRFNGKEVISCRPMRYGELYVGTYFSTELDEAQLQHEIERNLIRIRHALLTHVKHNGQTNR